MRTFEITIQRRARDGWPVVAQSTSTSAPYPVRRECALGLDPNALAVEAAKDYGEALGRALFRDDVREAFVQALAPADGPLHVLLFVEDLDLRTLRWERLAAPVDGRWVPLALGQRTPFAIHQPTATDRRFAPIGRPDLHALVVVANPTEPANWRLDRFDAGAIARGVRSALGAIPSDLLADLEEAAGPPTLDALARAISGGAYTLLHLVAHGRFRTTDGEPTVFLSDVKGQVAPVSASQLIARLGLTDGARGLPHLMFLSTCDSAAPEAEGVFGGLAQRLVRELGVPAVVAMTEKVTVAVATALGSAFYARLRQHGMADLALAQAFAGLAGNPDVAVPVPVLFSRLAGRPLFSLAPDGDLSDGEIRSGLERLEALLPQRGPVLVEPLRAHAEVLRGLLGPDPAHLAPERQKDRERALAEVDQVSLEAAELTFEALAGDEALPKYDLRCPFRGLEAFNPFRRRRPDDPADDPANDPGFFTSREALVDKLRDRLGGHPFLAVLGPSGSGKSSVVLAGLVPDLQRRDAQLQVSVLRPGPDPVAALDQALGGDGGAAGLVVVDQFEEAFTLCNDEGRRRSFLDRLVGLTPGRRVVITMRADFCGDSVHHPALREQVEAHQVLVPPMTADELRAAMERQAKAVGLRFETGLDATIFDDVVAEPGRMPLLQHALLELWNRRHGRLLKAEEYHALGRVDGAIARTAEAAYGELRDDRDRLRDLFLRLIRVDEVAATGEARRDSRLRVWLERLAPAGEGLQATRKLVNTLADRRLVVTTPGADDRLTEVEVAHEALIRHWPRLTTWIDESRAQLRLRQGVIAASEEWLRSGRRRAFLVHQGERLVEAERLRDDPRLGLSDPDRSYLDACVQQRRRRQVTAGVLTAVLAGALLIAVVMAWRRASDRDRAARTASRVLARVARERAQSLGHLNQPDQALLWIARGVAAATASGDAGLERMLRADLAGQRHAVHAHRALASLPIDGTLMAVSSDGRTLAVANNDMAVRLVDLSTGQLVGAPIPALLPRDPTIEWPTFGDMKFAPDGKTVLTRTGEDDRGSSELYVTPLGDRAFLWDAATGRKIAELTHADRVFRTAYRPKSGPLIVSAGRDGAVKFWSAEDGRPFGALDLSRSGVTGLAFTPDGEALVTAGDDGLRVWKTEDQTLLSGPVALPPARPVRSPALLLFGPQGKTLAAMTATDGRVSLWDVDGATVRFRRWLPGERSDDLAFGQDDATLFTLNREAGISKVTVWNLNSVQPLGTPYEAAAFRLVLSPDRTQLALRDPARLLDARTGRHLSAPLHEARDVAFTPDGGSLVLLGWTRAVRVVEVVPEGAPAAGPVPTAGSETAFRFSEDGGRLVSKGRWSQGDYGHGLVVSATADGRELGRVRPLVFPARLFDDRFTPDGATILTRSDSPRLVAIWDLASGLPRCSGLPVGRFDPHVVYRPDGRAVLIIQDAPEHTAQLWDLDGQPAGPPLRVGGSAGRVEFHPDGSVVLIVGDEIGVWNPATGRRIEKLGASGSGTPAEQHGPGAAAPIPPGVSTAGVPWQPLPLPQARFVANGRLLDVSQAVESRGEITGARHWLRDWRAGREVGPSFTAPYRSEPVVDPDGKTYAVPEADSRAVRIVSVETGQLVRRVKYPKPVRALTAEPRRGVVAVAAGDRVRFLSFADGKVVPGPEELPYPEDIDRLAFSADGQVLAVSGRTGPVEVWDLARNRRLGKSIPVEVYRPGQTAPVVALSPDGRILGLYSNETEMSGRSFRLFETTTGEPVGRPLALPEPLFARVLALSPDLRTAVVVNQIKQVTTWDATTGRATGGPVPDAPDTTAVAASSDGRYVLVRGPGGISRVHDVRSGRPIGEPFPCPGLLDTSAVFSPSGDRILTLNGQESPVLYEATLGTAGGRTLDHPGAVDGAFSRDGGVIVTVALVGDVRVWSASDGRLRGSFRAGGLGSLPVLSPSGDVLLYFPLAGPAFLWNVATGRSIGAPLDRTSFYPAAPTFRDDGRWLLTATTDQTVRLWDVATGWPIGAPVRLPGEVKAVAFGPGGETVLAVTGDGMLYRWSVPRPWAGSPEEIRKQVQFWTAQELDPEDDVIRPLSPDAWQRLRGP
jgi:WD40 repeat protein